MTTRNLVPRATGEGSLGTAAKKWGNIYADYITLADGETLQTKIANQNTRITTAEGTVTTLSGDVTSLYGSVETLSSGKVNKENPQDSEGNAILTEADVANNLTTEDEGSILDARQGKALSTLANKKAVVKYLDITVTTQVDGNVQIANLLPFAQANVIAVNPVGTYVVNTVLAWDGGITLGVSVRTVSGAVVASTSLRLQIWYKESGEA